MLDSLKGLAMADFVVVGASLTGAKAVETLREQGFTGGVTLVGEEIERPYERPPLSKEYLLGKNERAKAFVHDAGWYAEHDVDLRLATRVTDLDPAGHTVTLDGVTPLHYDKLLIATGSRVRRLNVPGAELPGVRYLRTIEQSDALLAQLRKGGDVAVIGAGWIGLEVAAAAKQHGASVTVIEMDRAPLRRVLGDEVAQLYADLHRANGVDLRFDASVTRITGDTEATGVELADGTTIPAQLVVVAVGIEPATELAVAGGLEVDNGIVTDAGLRTSDPDIYAAGDVANSMNPLVGRRIRVEHWANALNGGKAAARAMLGEEVVYDRVPYFYTDQFELGMEYSGYAEPGGFDRVVFRGGTSVSDGFIAFWTTDGRVLAGMNVNVWDVTDDIQKLVRAGYAGTGVDLERLADPNVPLGALLD
jgi:3-phenylpropionate/trans-cinnamate dioxygenase ferredoxin reductase subunit